MEALYVIELVYIIQVLEALIGEPTPLGVM